MRIAPETRFFSNSAGSLDRVVQRLPVLLPAELFHHLLGTFVGQVATARDQDEDDRRGQKTAEQQGARQQDQQLVLEAAFGDLPDDRQFARRIEAGHIGGGHRRIVDHHAGGLGSGLARGDTDIVDRRGGCAGDHGYVVEQGDQSSGHRKSFCRVLRLDPCPARRAATSLAFCPHRVMCPASPRERGFEESRRGPAIRADKPAIGIK